MRAFHKPGQRVRCTFDEREGVVIESDPVRTLIEFEDEDEGEPFKHQKWLPTRHWSAVTDDATAPSPLETQPSGGA